MTQYDNTTRMETATSVHALNVAVYTSSSTVDAWVPGEARQLAGCRAYALAKGLDLETMFNDGDFGSGPADRPGRREMMRLARRGGIDVVVVDDLARLGSDLPDLLAVYQEFEHLGIELHEVRTGRIDLAHVVVRGQASRTKHVGNATCLEACRLRGAFPRKGRGRGGHSARGAASVIRVRSAVDPGPAWDAAMIRKPNAPAS